MDTTHQGRPRPSGAPPQLCGRRYRAALAVVGLLAACAGCRGSAALPPNQPEAADNDVLAGPAFRDVTKDSGIQFTYRNGEEASHYAIPESLGGGVAAFDYDGDGRLDLFFTAGGHYDRTQDEWLRNRKVVPKFLGYPCKLYKNLGNFKFKDVTEEAGLGGEWFYTHGVAVGDYDRDGWPDFVVTGVGHIRLYHNVPADPKEPTKGRKFVEALDCGLTKGWAEGELHWASSAGWGDLDGDGWADLYVCQYGDWSFEGNHPIDCTYDGKTRDVCPPRKFTGIPHKLFHNNHDGTFTEVGKAAGLRVKRTKEEYAQLTWLDERARERLHRAVTEGDTKLGKGLGVIIADVNGDGKNDVYVANDTVDNFLYLNRRQEAGQLRFEERGLESGTARDDAGSPQGSMGLAVGDPAGTGRPDIWVTNYENELHALYRNECGVGPDGKRREYFLFASKAAGIAAVGLGLVGWGTGFLDVDHDGWEDIFLTAGHAIRHPKGAPRAQRPVLFRNMGAGKFRDASRAGGPYFTADHVGRGAVLADLDNDGRVDLVVSHLNEPAAVLRNEMNTAGNHWLGLQLAGEKRRDVVGAKIVIEAGGRKQTRFAAGGGSYCSAVDTRHVVGLGTVNRIDRITVYWPNGGKEQTWEGAAFTPGRYWRLTEGVDRAEEIKYPRD